MNPVSHKKWYLNDIKYTRNNVKVHTSLTYEKKKKKEVLHVTVTHLIKEWISAPRSKNCELNAKVESRKFVCFILKYSPAIDEEEISNVAGGMISN